MKAAGSTSSVLFLLLLRLVVPLLPVQVWAWNDDQETSAITMKHLWSTPLLEWHGIFPESQLHSFSKDVKDSYASYLQEQGDEVPPTNENNSNSTSPSCRRNNGFFHYQQKHPVNSNTMNLVWKAFLKGFDQYLTQAHIPPIDSGTSRLDWTKHCWAAVHHNGMFHEDHRHPRSALAGTLYLELPNIDNPKDKNNNNDNQQAGGALLLHDPRGPDPPFHRPYATHPREGTMVIFPSTLLHGVQPTENPEPRVSISCNHPGDWQKFSDSIPLEATVVEEKAQGDSEL